MRRSVGMVAVVEACTGIVGHLVVEIQRVHIAGVHLADRIAAVHCMARHIAGQAEHLAVGTAVGHNCTDCHTVASQAERPCRSPWGMA